MWVREWLIAAVAVVPFSVVLWSVFDTGDWRAWALLGTAIWWRVIGPLVHEGPAE